MALTIRLHIRNKLCLVSSMTMRWFLQICFTVMALLASASVGSAKCTHNGKVGTHLQHCSNGFICGFNATSNLYRNALIDEARRRGLSCKIGPIKKATNAPPSLLKKSFSALSRSDRKLVQSNLAQENLYAFKIDGLYGKGTAAALKAYNNKYLGNANLKQLKNAKKLISTILSIQPKVAAPVKPTPSPQTADTYNVASGTGFYVSDAGHIITNHHVIDGCKDIKVHSKGEVLTTLKIADDRQNDLAGTVRQNEVETGRVVS